MLNQKSKVVLLFSGGLDSTVLLAMLYHQTQNITLLHAEYGSKHQMQETEAAAKIAEYYGLPLVRTQIPIMNEFNSSLIDEKQQVPKGHYTSETMRSTVVPFRNGVLFSLAAGYGVSIKATHIASAVHADDRDTYPDCRPQFLRAMHQAVNLGIYPEEQIEFYNPLITSKKSDIVGAGAKFGAKLNFSYSCYEGDTLHCGECGTCVARKEAFKLAKIADLTEYKK